MNTIEIIRLVLLALQILLLIISTVKHLRRKYDEAIDYCIATLICGALVMLLGFFK